MIEKMYPKKGFKSLYKIEEMLKNRITYVCSYIYFIEKCREVEEKKLILRNYVI